MIGSLVETVFPFAYSAYLLAFIAATAVCLGAAWRARSVPYPETKQALTWFFLGSAGWAGSYVGFLLAGSAFGKHLFYQASLIVGFGTVFTWLWFCSAYSGWGLHRNRSVQQFAVAIYVVVTVLKGTNPLHGLYYGLEPAGGAFGLVVNHKTLYWVVMSMAYALSAAGYLMVFELFLKANARTWPLAVLTGLTALPAALNVIGHVDPTFLDITHEPLGVAVFAIGLLFAYETQFSVVQLTGGVGDPNLTIGSEGRIRGFGGGVKELVPVLDEKALGRPLAEVLPGLAKTISEEQSVWEVQFENDREEIDRWLQTEGDCRYFQVVQTGLSTARNTQTVILSDITERKRRERKLRESKRRFRAMLNDPNILAGVLSPDGTLQKVNDAALEYVEASREELLGRPFWGTPWWDAETGPLIREKVQQAANGQYVEYEEDLERRGGTPYRVSGIIRPVTNEEGEVVSLFVTARDITERKQRENTLQKLREKYQGLLEGAPDAIFVADADSRQIIEANQAAASMLGAPVDAIVGRDQSEIHPSGQAEQYRSLFKKSMQEAEANAETGAGLISELEDGSQAFVETDSGERVPVEISATLVELEGEETLEGTEAFVGIFRDITEQINREKALRKAKEEAQNASQMKSSLLANMSHEIRTPLTSIIGFAEAIGENQEVADRFAPLIEKSGKRLLQTLDSVLNLSKLEAEQMKFDEETVDLNAEAGALAEELLPQAEDAGIDCRVETSGEPARAWADEGGVQIVLRNLMTNAIKYTEEGGEVRVRTYGSDSAAVAEVEDTGIGMDPSAAESLFEPFRQASEGMDRAYEGTGLGLTVTRKIVEQMGGSIEVDTEEGKGSRFIVRLPAARELLATE